MADSVCGHKSQPAREEARKRAATLLWEIQVRSNSLHSDDLFVDEAKTGGDYSFNDRNTIAIKSIAGRAGIGIHGGGSRDIGVDSFADASSKETLTNQGFAVGGELGERLNAIDEVFREARARNYSLTLIPNNGLFTGIDYGMSVALQILRGVPVKYAKQSIDLEWRSRQ